MNLPYDRAINYSGYRSGQSPRSHQYPSKEEILEDLRILENDFYYLRIFDCSEHAYYVLEMIEKHQLNFKVMLGLSLAAEANFNDHPYFYFFSEAQLEAHRKDNQKKIQEIIDLANRYHSIVSSISIGNEVQSPWTNNLITEARLIDITKTIQSGTNLPVTFCEEYQHWINGLDKLGKQLDFISIHTYPAWRNIHISNAVDEAIKNYHEVKAKYPHKPCIITETGWPTSSHGSKIKVDEATVENQKQYVEEIVSWSKKQQILVYLFEAFDEPWKGEGHPDEPEKHWGLYNVERKKKW